MEKEQNKEKEQKKQGIQDGKILGMFPESSVPKWAMGFMATFFMLVVGFIMLVQFGGFQPLQTSWMDGYSKMQEAKVYKIKEMVKIDIEERRAEIELLKQGKSPVTRQQMEQTQQYVGELYGIVAELNETVSYNNEALKRHNIRIKKLEE